MLRIIVLGAAASSKSAGQTPNPEDVLRAVGLGVEFGRPVEVYLVDPIYIRYVRKLTSKHDIVDSEEELDRIRVLSDKPGVHIVTKRYEKWKTEDEDVKNFSDADTIIYLCYIRDLPFGVYEMMAFLGEPQTKNRFYVPTSCKYRPNITKFVIDWLAGDPIYSPYDISSGTKLSGVYQKSELDNLRLHLGLGCEIVSEYVRVGFHTKVFVLQDMGIKSWTLNPFTPFLKGLIDSYGMYPQCDDRTPEMEMCESADYRGEICLLAIKVLSNFAIQNKLIQIEQVGDWFNPALWLWLQQQISELDTRNNEINDICPLNANEQADESKLVGVQRRIPIFAPVSAKPSVFEPEAPQLMPFTAPLVIPNLSQPLPQIRPESPITRSMISVPRSKPRVPPATPLVPPATPLVPPATPLVPPATPLQPIPSALLFLPPR